MIGIDRLRALANAATPGPWEGSNGDLWSDTHGFLSRDELENADAAFIAAMRNALPELLGALEKSADEQDALAEDNITLRNTLAQETLRAEWAENRLRLALEILDGRFQPTDRIGDLHAAMTNILKGEL